MSKRDEEALGAALGEIAGIALSFGGAECGPGVRARGASLPQPATQSVSTDAKKKEEPT